jgi:uncharacterized RDD family membrane protein YckC
MSDGIDFETPENIRIAYEPAGLGTRFVAWIIDQILLWLLMAGLGILFLLVFAPLSSAIARVLNELARGMSSGQAPDVPFYFVGVFVLISGLGSFLYYGLSELLMRGQTIGKRNVSIRVVRDEGFSLDASSILIRNLFRVIDHIPILWIVPLLSSKSQRLGDMVAGTVIVSEQTEEMGSLREKLLAGAPQNMLFRFDPATLRRARPSDVEAVSGILERWGELPLDRREAILQKVCEPLAERLGLDPPPSDQRLRFLREFLEAEYRRQHRRLG